ncbi:hypothetical protein MRX96_007860 [Rhipicephalus microplus]
MREKVSKVTGQVDTLCAAAFDVEFEDVEGKCPAMGEPFSRLHTLKVVLEKAIKYTSDFSYRITTHDAQYKHP